jgi:predicted transposase/invertase (TIGR01784 family)
MSYVIPWERTAERRGRKKGRVEGIEEGRVEGKKETARKMLDDGLPIERIAQYTGLPYQEIEQLSAAAH